MFKILILFTAFLTVGCGNSAQTANSNYADLVNSDTQNVNKSANIEQKVAGVCDFNSAGAKDEIKNLYKIQEVDTNTYEPEKDPDLVFMKKIKACPREDVINSLLALREANKDDLEIRAKSSYLFVKLGYNKTEYGKDLLNAHSTWKKIILERYRDPNYAENMRKNKYEKIYRGDQIMSLIGDVLENDDDKAILSKSFELFPEVDGASAMGLFETFANEFKKNPEKFLKAIKGESEEIKKSVFERMCASIHKNDLVEKLLMIPKSSDVYTTSKEISGFIKQSKICEDNEQYFK